MTDPVFIMPPAPVHPGEHYQAEHAHDLPAPVAPNPVPVTLHYTKPVPVTDRAADWGPWTTYTLTATQAAFQLLPHDEHRKRAVIIVSGTGPVFVGSKAQCQASPVLGGQLNSGNVVELRNKRDLWLAPDGSHTATVTVLTERYEQ
jgi:hypothetical protein